MRYSGSPYALCSLVLFFILAVSGLVKGSSVNHTIDDFLGDSVTGELVQYLPQVPAGQEQLWINQKSCATCADVPDATLAFDKTWSAARYLASVGSLSVNMKFKGTAIYVFFIIPNFAANSGLASAVLCDFFIDGAAVGSFNHQSDGSGGFVYDTLVYKNTNVPDGDHVLLIETTGADPALIIFDYAIYTCVLLVCSIGSWLTTASGNLYLTLHPQRRLRHRPPLRPNLL
ncbi:hypothetical protein C8R47DRAFT_982390 [Mycena vitilis]|nr:hypothetical protein C8R47DRAFT_982390 [Mycena vitilis]